VHKLYAKQLAKATRSSGDVDLDQLGKLVSAAYEEVDNDRRRTDRSIRLMIEELDQLNRSLEKSVADRTAELHTQNMRFHAALSNMSQALLLFDCAGRMIICNRRYYEMYALAPEVIKPGCTLRELLKHRVDSGTMSGDVESYLASLESMIARGNVFERIFELPDGRTIAVVSHPMADGGWLATHEDITERRRADEQIAYMAHHDALTNLPNRLLLRETLSTALQHLPADERLAVLYLDLDHFKTVNDSLGHPIGDDLLKAVADRLKQCVRDGDVVARVGGDEFAIVQTGISEPDDAAVLAQRVCEAVRAPYEINGHAVIVDSSVGISLAPVDGSESDVLLKNADMALYRAKSDGRGGYCFFEPQMDARMQTRRNLELALRSALANHQFELHYQPILDLQSDDVSGCEALIRWRHPERGMIPPNDFIPLAEEIGLIGQIGEWVIRKACEDAAGWPDHVKVAVNLSPTQLSGSNLVGVVMNALARSRLPPHRLELEITEAVLLRNTNAVLETLHQLRLLGVRISMDDFGTGYSSLSYLRSFPFDKIKIDRTFIKGLPDDDSSAIVRAVTGLARSLNMVTTAEGVETQQQMDQVRALGCSELQGYLFSPPKRLEEICRLFARTKKRAAGAA
jgi:diguanylate cyclase (GGDEF)-like protein